MIPDESDGATSFADLGLRSGLLEALSGLGYEEPTPIQREAIPPLVERKDLVGQAATGTGKTAAFALPVLQRLPEEGRGPGPTTLVLVPTRELAVQVSQAFHRYGRGLGVRVLPIYGGQPIGWQVKALGRGVDVVIATPGRALDHIGRETLRLHDVQTVVLDEADEMLDMGFADDIEEILQETPEDRQTVLFSATLPPRIEGLAGRYLKDPVRIQMGRETGQPPGMPPLIRQSAYMVARAHKPAALGRVLDVEAPTAAIVFCRTREEVDQLTETLNGRGYRAEALHGGMSQEQRDRVMGRLRSGAAELLIATDVAARGLDVEHLTHVVNYNVPSASDSYVHRIGRIGRAGREGVAITLAEPREHRMLKAIERATRQRISVEKIPTVADLRARRLEMTRATLNEVLLEDDLEHYRAVVESLTEEYDIMEVALAAVKLAYDSSGAATDEEEIPQIAERAARDGKDRRDTGGRRERRGNRSPAPGMTRLFFGVGRGSGIRPQDLVGAIAGESRLSGRDIGAIEIADRFSLVEVPEAAADDVINALRRSTIKGRKATVRRERDAANKR
ncbi:DEAD/DEAH box helicase [Actinomadura sp. DC4]|uniref:DEAD/DEAH box helicase n=1 Tax=Actinomadura sp. DC4 TaxID=3055069 RepID=UPI0025B10D13|nr:DEAD/DEAH box helicase [Actinomadura sp. DC4]MDN3353706.1 DEAD/DEAH box helicase [Actinomadura sp. DC4]